MKFLDDDSSLYEGAPLLRYFRLRKWALIVVALLISLGNSWFGISNFSKKVFFSKLPDGVFHKLVWLLGLYILFQLLLLLAQVISTYNRDLKDRILKGLGQELDALYKEQRELELKRRVELEQDLEIS